MWFLYFLKDFAAVPALLVGLFTLIGALIQRKKASQTVISVFKVVIGFLVMGGGAGLLVKSLSQFQPVFQETYGLSGVIPNNDGLAGAMAGALPSIVSLGSIIMVVGMLMNIGLAVVSRMKYVYLSGHVLYYASIMLALVMYTVGMDFENNAGDYALAVFTGASVLATYMIISPALAQRYMKQIVGTDEIAIGHTGAFGYAFSGFLGEMIGKVSKKEIVSTESIKFPQSLYFFRNTLVSITLTVLVFYMAAFLPGGIMYEMGNIKSADALNVLSGKNWIVTMIVAAFTFTAGVETILMGVRLFIGELVPMFKGISDKLIKGSKAAVDCPVVFPYAPNAVLIGFISSFFGGLIGMGITIGMHSGGALVAVILPGLIPHFFLGATSGVFGNVKGGILGAMIGPFIMGIIITFVPVIFIAGGWVPIGSDGGGGLHELAIKGALVDNADKVAIKAAGAVKELSAANIKDAIHALTNQQLHELISSNTHVITTTSTELTDLTAKHPQLLAQLTKLMTNDDVKSAADGVEGLNWGDTDYIIGAVPGVFGLISKYAAFGISIVGPIAILVDGIIARIKGWGPYSPEAKAKLAADAEKAGIKVEEKAAPKKAAAKASK